MNSIFLALFELTVIVVTFIVQVACMQFINIVVHSVENMNFRVHLQHEFTEIGLDDYLEVCSVHFPFVRIALNYFVDTSIYIYH